MGHGERLILEASDSCVLRKAPVPAQAILSTIVDARKTGHASQASWRLGRFAVTIVWTGVVVCQTFVTIAETIQDVETESG